jgi:UDP-N-acetylmuramyl tripeptide synthase
MQVELTDSRRLTGANLFWDHPGAIIDVALDGEAGTVISSWQRAVEYLLEALGRPRNETKHRIFDGGASLLISAPVDALYSMCELNEVAWACALHELGEGEKPDLEAELQRLKAAFEGERNPVLLALQAAAHQHGVPFLLDDDEVSVGYGATAQVWKPDQLPAPEDVDWPAIHSIPLALVTGTNGKSTTVRMVASIIAAAGLRAGLTSTDFIRVGDEVLDTGDYSGTGGARMLMRHPEVEMAVLEVARGGLLRRGLGVERANSALITNVAADHLGEWGINTVPELTEAKFIVRRALHGDAPLILNADDAGVVGFAQTLNNSISWYSLDANNPVILSSLAEGGVAAFLKDGWLVCSSQGKEVKIVSVGEIPTTMGGIVRHNISNALGAMSIALALGLGVDAIRQGLSAFRGDEQDNPGRGNWFEHKGVRILVDFAHNDHGMTALAETVKQVAADRVVLLMGQAGDRLDADIRTMTRTAGTMQPYRLLVCELPGYERGREPFTVPALIRAVAIEAGVPEEAIEIFPAPGDAVADALKQAVPGDFLVLLALTQRNEVLELIHQYMEEM